MKIKILLLALAGCLAAGCGTHMKSRPTAKWENPANWDDLEKGMNKAQVRARLGRPPIEGDFDLSGYENWYYPNLDGGVVQLDATGRVTGFHRPPGFKR